MGLRALIFDFNGVLVDDEPLHFALCARILAEEGVILSWEEYYAKYLPCPVRDLFAKVMRDKGVSFDAARIARLAEQEAKKYSARSEGVTLFPGAVEFVREAGRRFPLAVASGAKRDEIELALTRVGLLNFFQAIVGAEDVAR